MGEVFGNDLLASAALDHVTHHTHTHIIRGDSFRQRIRRTTSGKENQMVESISETPIKQES